MKKSIEVIFNLILWIIITYIFYYNAKTNAHIAVTAVNNYGKFHIPYLDFVVFFTLLPPIINFYLFYLILIPKLLVRKKTVLFFAFALISSILVGYLFRLTFGGIGSFLGKLVFFTVIEHNRIKIKDTLIPISDSYKEQFYNLIGIKNS